MSGHCKRCGVYHEEDDSRLCGTCGRKQKAAREFSFSRDEKGEVFGRFVDVCGGDQLIESFDMAGHQVLLVGGMYLTAEQAEGLVVILGKFISDGNIDALCPREGMES